MTLSTIDAEYLRGVVRRVSGNYVDPTRDYLFESRLQRVLRNKGMHSLDQLIVALRAEVGSALRHSVAEAMTINETSFFRDTASFDLLRDELIPSLITARAGARALRIWSAASSSGQEAYSIAMLLREQFPSLAAWRVEIFGTDLSAEMVDRARAGRYQRIEVNRGLPARLLLKHFVRVDDEWEVSSDIRRVCHFQQRNLCDALPMGEAFDLILLRNVMIYFPEETRHKVLLAMHRSLAPDGALLLGMSEQPRMDSHWETILTPKSAWYRPVRAS